MDSRPQNKGYGTSADINNWYFSSTILELKNVAPS